MSARLLCLGVAVEDYVFALPEMPKKPHKYRATDFTTIGGGIAANAAVAISRLGGTAFLATRLGEDALGASIVAELEAEGVDCRLARRFAGCRSSLSMVLVDATGERMIVNYRDPGLPEETDWLPEPAELGLAGILVDTRWTGGAATMLRRARAAGLPGVLDVEPPVAPATEAMAAATHLAFSRDGLAEWAGTEEIEEGLAVAAERTDAFLCVTDGADGTFFRKGAESGHVPAFEVEVVDTLAAGDVWHGAFALALAEGRDEVAALRFASAAAAIKCTGFGGRAAIPDRPQVESFLMEHAA
ncbi:PfkB family carbohydrate kinase [Afifella sp. IM 167]|uniref:PfkB family carbohydrate kinase n=1 Tax=Afifella sp. IM 167 TaxID=2033586 RepID=UPI001CC9919F|nr:PfkB family carbohydrate kinase [Afifella sp. IM 167]MBZ8134961.1 sugar kinase [Afifella sp. IM 167]